VSVEQEDGETRASSAGYQLGGGLEIALGSRMRLFGEYLWTSLDNRDESVVRAQGPAPATNPFILTNGAGTDFRRTGRFEWQSARAGLALRF
jgi:outer membrane immunogenic protein